MRKSKLPLPQEGTLQQTPCPPHPPRIRATIHRVKPRLLRISPRYCNITILRRNIIARPWPTTPYPQHHCPALKYSHRGVGGRGFGCVCEGYVFNQPEARDKNFKNSNSALQPIAYRVFIKNKVFQYHYVRFCLTGFPMCGIIPYRGYLEKLHNRKHPKIPLSFLLRTSLLS